MSTLQEQYQELLMQAVQKAAEDAVHRYRKEIVAEQIKKARGRLRDYSSVDGGSGTIALIKKYTGTVRIQTILAVVGSNSGTITITLGNDKLVFPQNPPGGYIFLGGENAMDIYLGAGDTRSLVIATPGNPLFFGIWGEQVGDGGWVA